MINQRGRRHFERTLMIAKVFLRLARAANRFKPLLFHNLRLWWFLRAFQVINYTNFNSVWKSLDKAYRNRLYLRVLTKESYQVSEKKKILLIYKVRLITVFTMNNRL